MKIKVAIYSGVIPSTIFIENLIKSIADKNLEIFLFGQQKKQHKYKYPNIKVFVNPTCKSGKIIYFLKQNIFLLINKPSTFYKLVKYYYKNSNKINPSLIMWLYKILPVVNNLPDIFHIQWAKSLSFWFFLKEIFNTKIILSLRGAHINYSPLSDIKLATEYRKLFPSVDFFHAVSKSILKEASKYSNIEKKTKVIYSAFDFSMLKNLKQKKYRSNREQFHFISVGRFHWKKAYHLSILAVNELLKKGINVTYTIIAIDHPSEEILYEIKDLDISDKIFIKSISSQEKVYQEISNSDCLILPSTEEGIANVVIESMAIGTPVISSDCGGMKEIISKQYNGFLFKSRDLFDLVEKMEKTILLNGEEKDYLIKNAKLTVEKKFSIMRLGNEIEEIYTNILKK